MYSCPVDLSTPTRLGRNTRGRLATNIKRDDGEILVSHYTRHYIMKLMMYNSNTTYTSGNLRKAKKFTNI